jgi:two-component sensor histidine kinase
MPSDPATHQLQLRQRALLADLGACALKAENLDALLQEACGLVAAGLDVRLCKVLEYLPATGRLLVRAGIGWHDGVVGHATLGADDGSPAGHALSSGQPVISNDLTTEPRFRTPRLLLDHGVRRAMNVIIRGDGQPFGVLEVDSRQPGDFLPDDVSFMQVAANLLGVAVERARREAELREALDRHELVLREADHRVKNSLQLVASLLTLQRSRLSDPGAIEALDDAIARVQSVAETHRALYRSRDLRTVGLADMLGGLCAQVGRLSPNVTVLCRAPPDLELDAERALPLGLIVSELLTNAIRHAYPDRTGGVVQVTAGVEQEFVVIRCTDEGVGTQPPTGGGRTLGTNIVSALARQIAAVLEVEAAPGKGTVASLRLPIAPAEGA